MMENCWSSKFLVLAQIFYKALWVVLMETLLVRTKHNHQLVAGTGLEKQPTDQEGPCRLH